MRKKSSCFILLVFFFNGLIAQHHGSGATSTSATSSSTSSTSSSSQSNSQTGFVYRLKNKYHIKYSSIHISIPISDTCGSGCKNAETQKTFIIKDSIMQVQGKITSKDSPYFCSYLNNLPVVTTICDNFDTCCNLRKCSQDTITIDSLSRYWNVQKFSIWNPLSISKFWYPLFHKYALRVSIIQLDSGKLQVQILRTNRFDNSSPNPAIDLIKSHKLLYYPFPLPILIEQADYLTYKKLSSIKFNNNPNVIKFAIPITEKDSANNFYLQIPDKYQIGDPIKYISLPYGTTQYGAMTIPIKYRWAPHKIISVPIANNKDTLISAPSESTASINLSAYIGRRWGRTRFYYNPSNTHNTLSFMVAAFGGLGVVPLSSSDVESSVSLTTLPAQIITFSYGGSAIGEYKSFDFGFFVGQDLPLFAKNTGWIYADKWWIGFGIGVNLSMFTNGTAQTQSLVEF